MRYEKMEYDPRFINARSMVNHHHRKVKEHEEEAQFALEKLNEIKREYLNRGIKEKREYLMKSLEKVKHLPRPSEIKNES